MIDLSTRYLGLNLPHPFMPGASPLARNMDLVRRLEDAGAAAIVMYSLFEEQLLGEQRASEHFVEMPSDSFAEAQTYFPSYPELTLGPEEYLEQLRKVKEAVSVPVIASLNGTTAGGWLEYSRQIAEAGADAIELNVFRVASNPDETSEVLEEQILAMVRVIVKEVSLPLAVKLSHFYTALANFARRLDQAGSAGIILFNRFYQPDIDPEELEVIPTLQLSSSSELLLRVHWLAVLSGRIEASLAVTGGVHTAVDAIKAIMAGAHAVQLVSALLTSGPEHLRVVREGVVRWMEEKEYASLEQMRGNMNLLRCPDPRAFERLNYARILHSWKGFL